MITAKIVADSVTHHSTGIAKRITTFEVEYPRMVHCFDKETEILSQILNEAPQFRSFEAVFALDAKVAQYDNGNIIFVKPLSHIKQEGKFNMISLEKDSKKLSMVVTDEHRVYSLKRTTDNNFKHNTILAKELLENYGTLRIPKAGYHEQDQFYTNSELQLIAWFVADGYWDGREAQFHFRKPRKINTVKTLLNACGIPYKEAAYNEDVVIKFEAPSWVSSCYDQDRNKVIPDLATMMGQEGYRVFKQALLESDGNVDNNEYNTTSTKLAEQIQVIALLHGDSMNIRQYGSGLYKQKFQHTNYVSLRQDKDKFISKEEETIVYCVTVPSGYVVVRRDGNPFISGNCELMTHRVFSRNAASSRAIPVEKVIEMVETNPAMPVYWGLNQTGMQAKKEHDDPELCRKTWIECAKSAIVSANKLKDLGLHKQLVNRGLEPYQNIKVLVTSTSFDNWFYLRCHSDAQPEIKALADLMWQEWQKSVPTPLKEGQWHLPYIHTRITDNGGIAYELEDGTEIDLETAKEVSSSCCAQVSYRKLDTTVDKARKIYNQLVTMKPTHASPFEHLATPMTQLTNLYQKGVTGVNAQFKPVSGNFQGWLQYRQFITDNVCDHYYGQWDES